MTVAIPLTVSSSATFGADGRATASLGPSTFGQKWTIDRIVVVTDISDPTSTTQFRIYKGSEQDSAMVDSTYNGNNDTSETSITLQTLESVLGVWSQGVEGSHATMILYGTIDTGRKMV